MVKSIDYSEFLDGNKDYWILIKETSSFLYYLSKSKKLLKKRKNGFTNRGDVATRKVALTIKDKREIDIDYYWNRKFVEELKGWYNKWQVLIYR